MEDRDSSGQDGRSDSGEEGAKVIWDETEAITTTVSKDLPMAEKGFIPEYEIVVILEKTLGPDAPNFVRRVLRAIKLDYNRIPVLGFQRVIVAIDNALTPDYSTSIRSKVRRDLLELMDKYR